jgi:hypothetical protein
VTLRRPDEEMDRQSARNISCIAFRFALSYVLTTNLDASFFGER